MSIKYMEKMTAAHMLKGAFALSAEVPEAGQTSENPKPETLHSSLHVLFHYPSITV